MKDCFLCSDFFFLFGELERRYLRPIENLTKYSLTFSNFKSSHSELPDSQPGPVFSLPLLNGGGNKAFVSLRDKR